MKRIVIVDDDPAALRAVSGVAERAGFSALTVTSGEAALRLLRSDPGIAAVVLDLVMPDLDGMAVMQIMAREGIRTPVIVQTAESSMDAVASATRAGALDFVVKPVAPERLVVSLNNAIRTRELERLIGAERARREGTLSRGDIVARSPAMARVVALCAKAAKTSFPVLIEGENGTGKETIARVIHGMADRGSRPFARIDCSTGQLDAVLPSGTVLIDEVGELSREAQARLCTLLDGTGSRVIATTSRRLLNLAKSGEMREDLYYKLTVLPIYLPPLRDRIDDFAHLAARFLARSCAETGRRITGISPEALALLSAYSWPGNVRQLENSIHRAVTLAEGTELMPADFPQVAAAVSGRAAALKLTESLTWSSSPVHIDAAIPRRDATGARDNQPDRFLTAKGDVAPLSDLERELIAFAIRHYAGQMSRAARALKIGRSTLYRKLREYGLEDVAESDAA